jgi:hypothetical protein
MFGHRLSFSFLFRSHDACENKRVVDGVVLLGRCGLQAGVKFGRKGPLDGSFHQQNRGDKAWKWMERACGGAFYSLGDALLTRVNDILTS